VVQSEVQREVQRQVHIKQRSQGRGQYLSIVGVLRNPKALVVVYQDNACITRGREQHTADQTLQDLKADRGYVPWVSPGGSLRASSTEAMARHLPYSLKR